MRYWRYEASTDELELWETREGFTGWSLVLAGTLDAALVRTLDETQAQSLAIRVTGIPLPSEFAAE